MAPLILAAGYALQMYGQWRGSQDQAAALEDAARLQLINAGQARAAGAFDAQRQQVVAQQRIGSMEAGYGASGVKGTGSVMDVIGMSRGFAELDRLNILHGAELRAINFENEASFNRTSAAGTRGLGFMSAAATGLKGAGDIYGASNTKTASHANKTQSHSEEFRDGYLDADSEDWDWED